MDPIDHVAAVAELGADGTSAMRSGHGADMRCTGAGPDERLVAAAWGRSAAARSHGGLAGRMMRRRLLSDGQAGQRQREHRGYGDHA
jgi:hypothetical protein